MTHEIKIIYNIYIPKIEVKEKEKGGGGILFAVVDKKEGSNYATFCAINSWPGLIIGFENLKFKG